MLVTGTLVTGSGPHSGDEAADRLPFAGHHRRPGPQPHGVGVPASRSCSCCAGRPGRRRPDALGRGRLLVGVILAQGTLGYVQYFAGVPELLVGAHVLGSVLVWVAALRFHLALTEPIPPAGRPPPARPRTGGTVAPAVA